MADTRDVEVSDHDQYHHEPVAHQSPDEEVSRDGDNEDGESVGKGDDSTSDLRSTLREDNGTTTMAFFLVFSFISWVFMLAASCPVPIFRGGGDKWTIWKDADGTRWAKADCKYKSQMFQAIEAFTVVGCVVCLGAFIAGVLQMTGNGHLGVTLSFSFFATATTLVAWSLGVHQYKAYSCGERNEWRSLHAGFALTFISFALMLFGTFGVGYHAITHFALNEEGRKRFNAHALGSAFITGVCLLLTVVSSAETMFTLYDEDVKLTMWRLETFDPATGVTDYHGISEFYDCAQLTKFFRASQSFVIISSCFLFFTLLSNVAAVYVRGAKWATVAFGCMSWATLLVCWAVLVGARYKTFCKTPNSEISFEGVVITDGLAMLIAAWCITTVNTVYIIVKG